MTVLTLTEKADPIAAERAIWGWLSNGNALRVRLHGFPQTSMRAILDRLPTEVTVSRPSPAVVVLRPTAPVGGAQRGPERSTETVFYNLRVGRPNAQVERELRAFAREQPGIIMLSEAVGYDLPALPGYRLVRDRSNQSRANIAAYVRVGLGKVKSEWIDLDETWTRWKNDEQHPARSFLALSVAGLDVYGAHQAPKGTDNTRAAQMEGVRALAGRMLDPAPSLLLWDANRKPGERGPGPSLLARLIGGRTHGDGIDNAVTDRATVTGFRRRRVVGGVRLRSDHGHAVQMRVTWRAS